VTMNQAFFDPGVMTSLARPARSNWRSVQHTVALETEQCALSASE